jgi:uncharacterized protein
VKIIVTCVAIFQTMQKKDFQEFDINLYQLKNKQYKYDYRLEESFFQLIENSLVSKGMLEVAVEIDKNEYGLVVNYSINGNVELVCDRSLETFEHPINIKEQVIYKYGEENEELSESLFVIKRDTQKLNLAHSMYELVAVVIPYKKLHPKYGTQDGDEQNDGELVYKSDDDEVDEPSEEQNIDPRWAELLKLRKN